MNIPILILAYNRPDLLLKTLHSLKTIKPSNVFVVCDGPNHNKESDIKNCGEVRKIVEKNIDWPCLKQFDFRSQNYGLKRGVSSAINWFFEKNEFGIILEDDIFTTLDFFKFCEELLVYYRDNEKIKVINGSNFQNGIERGESFYYFSKYAHCWGWATWKRAWLDYDVEMHDFKTQVAKNFLNEVFYTKEEQLHWINTLNLVFNNQINSWAYPLMYSVWKKQGICITPNNNLTKNIGFDQRATHTVDSNSHFAKMRVAQLDWSKPHPKKINVDHGADLFSSQNVYFIRANVEFSKKQCKYLPAKLMPSNWNFPQKAFSAPQSPVVQQGLKPRLNLGCGSQVHPDWTNVDIMPRYPGVINHDLNKRLPFADASFEVVYHSHVLEHLTKEQGKAFVAECYRVLKPGGILRVVVPDLEMIARLYLENLDKAEAGDGTASNRHEWMLLELLDQMVRETSGGEMGRYFQLNPMPAEDFVIERFGHQVLEVIRPMRANPASRNRPVPPLPRQIDAMEAARFRQSGEIHKWMYDRRSLGRLLAETGFDRVAVKKAGESSIPEFCKYFLDRMPDGSTRKPDSLFVEAFKP
jgi:predicted SAM-dependent methyltransferase